MVNFSCRLMVSELNECEPNDNKFTDLEVLVSTRCWLGVNFSRVALNILKTSRRSSLMNKVFIIKFL